MYNYDFSNEKVKFEKFNTLVEINGNIYNLNILVTNRNILLFKDINSDFVKQKAMGVFLSSEYELVKSVPLKHLNYTFDGQNTYINKEEIIIYDFYIDDFIK